MSGTRRDAECPWLYAGASRINVGRSEASASWTAFGSAGWRRSATSCQVLCRHAQRQQEIGQCTVPNRLDSDRPRGLCVNMG